MAKVLRPAGRSSDAPTVAPRETVHTKKTDQTMGVYFLEIEALDLSCTGVR